MASCINNQFPLWSLAEGLLGSTELLELVFWLLEDGFGRMIGMQEVQSWPVILPPASLCPFRTDLFLFPVNMQHCSGGRFIAAWTRKIILYAIRSDLCFNLMCENADLLSSQVGVPKIFWNAHSVKDKVLFI